MVLAGPFALWVCGEGEVRILNLYSGLGGNRSAWGYYEVTAVESNPKIAAVYQDRFPQDNVVVGDAHEYLLKNFNDYDFIWSSPPCQTHSSFRQNLCVRFRGTEAVYPDMKLYQEILLLQHNSKALFIVENVTPYYKPLINPTGKAGRHLIWSNFIDGEIDISKKPKLRNAQIPELQKYHNIDLSKYDLKGLNKRQLLRNCVDEEIGEKILLKIYEGN